MLSALMRHSIRASLLLPLQQPNISAKVLTTSTPKPFLKTSYALILLSFKLMSFFAM